ncbi:RNA polymerase III subunit RPC82 helix-turn-helix domain-containing protein [Ditylenchus destructor]|uniref:DNA-directed RNA polymerase III subunit RPC3 n=1 Tax=Ditylenchus destructor TaxID=166010 RepID=A0AAD4N5G1_9BILA|nr:RNA polymerase III subunit RPC82 helix-turn-helix domain-containing protein [Ditylenchus destructor]
MPSTELELCTSILEDYFGYYVSTVGEHLMSNRMPLPLILRSLVPKKMSSVEVKRSIAILDHHNFLQFEYTSRGVIYSVHPPIILYLLRIPRCVCLLKALFGQVAEVLFTEFASMGKLSCSDAIRRVCKKLELKDHSEVKSQFARLVQIKMLIRCPIVKADDIGFPIFEETRDHFLMPHIILDADEPKTVETKPIKEESGSRKRKFVEPDERKCDSDCAILWKINWPAMEVFLREDLVIDALSSNEVFDKTTLHVARVLVKVSETKQQYNISQSNPISVQDVLRYAKDNNLPYSQDLIRDKLTLLGMESNALIRRVGDSGNGLYIIEEDQIEKHAMLSAKEAKQTCYALVDNNFITTRQIAKTNDFAPARTFYLYSVAMSQILGSMIALTTGALRNVIRRRMFEAHKYQALTDRNDKLENIIININAAPELDEEAKKEEIMEVQKLYMTDGDRAELEKFKRAQTTFCSTEIELERVLFIFQQAQIFIQAKSEQEVQTRKRGRRSGAAAAQANDGSGFPFFSVS